METWEQYQSLSQFNFQHSEKEGKYQAFPDFMISQQKKEPFKKMCLAL